MAWMIHLSAANFCGSLLMIKTPVDRKSFFRRHLLGPLILGGAMLGALLIAGFLIFETAPWHAQMVAEIAFAFWAIIAVIALIDGIRRLFATARDQRISSRIRDGLCPSCGYDLRS
jgi:hypothetical protein